MKHEEIQHCLQILTGLEERLHTIGGDPRIPVEHDSLIYESRMAIQELQQFLREQGGLDANPAGEKVT